MNTSAAYQLRQDLNPTTTKREPNSVFQCHRRLVTPDYSDWAVELKKRLEELTALPRGWDGYDGQPVSFNCARFTMGMLERLFHENVPAPSIVPGSDGTLQVEWHRNMYDVELDVLGANNIIATRYNLSTEEEDVLEIQNDVTEIYHWIAELSDEANIVS